MKNYQILLFIALMFVTLFVFYPALSAQFVNLDDKVFVEGNWKITSFSLANIKSLIFDSHVRLYHPLVNLSFAVEYYLYGNDPHIYHAVNVMLHLLSVLLVFFIFMLITGKNFWISFITTLIFACHPMHVESVAWVSGRKDTLYTVFFLASVWTYLKAQEIGSKKTLLYAFSVILFLLACLSKSMAVTLPAILILIDWFMGKKFDMAAILKYLPYFAVAAAFAVMTYILYYGASEKLLVTDYMLFNNFIAAHFHLIFYLVKFIWPANLAVVYPVFYQPGEFLPDFIMLSPAFIYMLALLAAVSLNYTKKIVFGFVFFLLTILPVINILPTGIAAVADRYTYVPYIGLAFIAACAAVFIYKKIRVKIFKNVFVAFVCVLLSVMCVSCRSRVDKWHDTASLFDSQIAAYPGEVGQAYAIRAIEYANSGNVRKAEKYLQEALRIDPYMGLAIITLADLHKKQGRFEEAIALYKRLPGNDLNITIAYVNMMYTYMDMGEDKKAENILNIALKNKSAPSYAFVYYNAGKYYELKENYEKALEYFQMAKKAFPRNGNAYLEAGLIYERQRKFTLAGEEYIEGLMNCENDRNLLFALGAFYSKLTMYDIAEQRYLKLIELYPDDYLAYDALGNVYSIMKKYREALFCYTMAVLIKNDFDSAYFHRAVIYLMLRQFDKAAENARKALSLGYELPQDFKDDFKSYGIIL